MAVTGMDLLTAVRDLAELLHAPPPREANLDTLGIQRLMETVAQADTDEVERALRLVWWPVGAQPVELA